MSKRPDDRRQSISKLVRQVRSGDRVFIEGEVCTVVYNKLDTDEQHKMYDMNRLRMVFADRPWLILDGRDDIDVLVSEQQPQL